MANTHTTLTSLFSDLANAIRKVMGTSEPIVADDMPDVLNTMERISIGNQFSVAISGINSQQISELFIPTVFQYYGGWWWLAGNDSNNTNTYFARSTDLQSWTVIPLIRYFPVKGIGFSGNMECLFIWSTSQAYKNWFVVKVPNPTTFTSGSYSYWANTNFSFSDACSNNGGIWAVGNSTQTYSVLPSSPSSLTGPVSHGSITQNYYKCSAYKDYVVAISQNDYYIWKTSINTSYVAGEVQIDTDITALSIAEMGDYLCVIVTKNGGTYLYYSNGTPGNLSWNNILINTSTVTPIGMGYANNTYTIGYLNNNVLNFWSSNTLSDFSTNFCINNIHLDNQSNAGILSTGDGNSTMATIIYDNNVASVVYYSA